MQRKDSLSQKSCICSLRWGYPDGLTLMAAIPDTVGHTPCELVVQACQRSAQVCSVCGVDGYCVPLGGLEMVCLSTTDQAAVGAACTIGGDPGTCQASGVCQVGNCQMLQPLRLQQRPSHVSRTVLGWHLVPWATHEPWLAVMPARWAGHTEPCLPRPGPPHGTTLAQRPCGRAHI